MRMQCSGYDIHFREQIARSALKAYETIQEQNEKGEQPMYRLKQWKLAERTRQKRDKRRIGLRKEKVIQTQSYSSRPHQTQH